MRLPLTRPNIRRITTRMAVDHDVAIDRVVAVAHDVAAQRFTAAVDGHTAALDYSLSAGVMSITHTRVPEPIAGRGIAAELTRAALEAARAAGWTVNPVCSYAAAYMRRNPR